MIINGQFKNNELALYGELKIHNDSSSSLEVNGEYKDTDTILTEKYIFIKDNNQIVTLKDALYYKKSRTKSILTPNMVFISNKKYTYNLEEIDVKKVILSLDNINNFYGNNSERTSKNIDIIYQDYNIKISFQWDFNIGQRKNIIEISSTNIYNFKEYQNIIYKLVTFISFAIGDIANQKDTYFIDKDGNKVKIYYTPSFYKKDGKPKQSVLFDMHNINIQSLFNGWVNLLAIADPLIPLYFMPYFYKIDLNVKYILLTQGLEAFHRKITRNDNMIFIKRIKDIVFNDIYKKFLLQLSNEEELEDLCKKIRTTRNYLTHYNVNQENEILEGKEKIFTCIKLELFIDLYLLKYIGFLEDDFKSIYNSVIKDSFDRENVIQTTLANKYEETNNLP
jgi:hypothetical protein